MLSETSRVEEVLRGNQSILPDLNTDSQQGGDRLDDISDHHEAHDIQGRRMKMGCFMSALCVFMRF